MRWEGGRQSDNLEDRRRMSPRGMAIGGGGALLIVIVGLLLGLDPKTSISCSTTARGRRGRGPSPLMNPSPQRKPAAANSPPPFSASPKTSGVNCFARRGSSTNRRKWFFLPKRRNAVAASAPSAVGPFYCPADRTVYLDPTFFAELQDRLGGSERRVFAGVCDHPRSRASRAEPAGLYSRIVDEKRRTSSKDEANRWSVRLELQADYLAGVWAHYGQEKFRFIEDGDVESAIQSANAIGDDRLQKRATGFVSPEKFTHGTSAQRTRWFRRGLETGDTGQAESDFRDGRRRTLRTLGPRSVFGGRTSCPTVLVDFGIILGSRACHFWSALRAPLCNAPCSHPVAGDKLKTSHKRPELRAQPPARTLLKAAQCRITLPGSKTISSPVAIC